MFTHPCQEHTSAAVVSLSTPYAESDLLSWLATASPTEFEVVAGQVKTLTQALHEEQVGSEVVMIPTCTCTSVLYIRFETDPCSRYKKSTLSCCPDSIAEPKIFDQPCSKSAKPGKNCVKQKNNIGKKLVRSARIKAKVSRKQSKIHGSSNPRENILNPCLQV